MRPPRHPLIVTIIKPGHRQQIAPRDKPPGQAVVVAKSKNRRLLRHGRGLQALAVEEANKPSKQKQKGGHHADADADLVRTMQPPPTNVHDFQTEDATSTPSTIGCFVDCNILC